MSALSIVIYEVFYTIIYLGLLLSKSTLLQYFPDASIISRSLFLIVLFSGFFIPSYLKLLKIRLTAKHYLFLLTFFSFLYVLFSFYYYSTILTDPSKLQRRSYNVFFQSSPYEQNVVIPKPAGVFRILCLGGSTTKGKNPKPWAVGQGYPRLLEEMLQKKYPQKKIEVINAGQQFYTTQHSIMQYLFFLKDLDPDIIILFHAINDLLPSFTTPPWSSKPFRKDYGHYTGSLNLVRPLPKRFEKFLYQFLFADLRKPSPEPVTFSDFKSLFSFRWNLETLIVITKSQGIFLILSNQAHLFKNENETDLYFLGYPLWFLVDEEHYADEKSWYEGMKLFNETSEKIAEGFSIPFVDQVAAVEGKRELFRDVIHMTQEGTELKARLFYDKILQLKIILEESNN